MLKTIQQRISDISYSLRVLTASEAAQELKQNGGILVDVREPAEAEKEPTPGSVNFPRGVLEMKMLEKYQDEATPVYLHCASGVRARLAAEQLMLLGYLNVSVVDSKVIDICKYFEQ